MSVSRGELPVMAELSVLLKYSFRSNIPLIATPSTMPIDVGADSSDDCAPRLYDVRIERLVRHDVREVVDLRTSAEPVGKHLVGGAIRV